MPEESKEKKPFVLSIKIEDSGEVDIRSEGVCHHLFLLGVLESIKHDVLNVASGMQPSASAFVETEEIKGEE